MSKSTSLSSGSQRGAIHQLLIGFTYGDAISNQARWIQKFLQEQGYDSQIYTHYFEVGDACQHCEELPLDEDSSLIYHHSMGFEYLQLLSKFRGKKALIYHNITPYEYFLPYDTMSADLLRLGREQLIELVDLVDESYGDSLYNVKELRSCGFKDSRVLPLLVSPKKWESITPRADIISRYKETKVILFTGRLSPHKAQTDLIEMLHTMQTIDQECRLILVGGGEGGYLEELQQRIAEYALSQSVILAGHVDDATLKAYYEVADVFVSMSEHEGFGVPLIEASWFDIPVVAFKSSAIAETLGSAALLFTDKKEISSIAALISVVLDDEEVRRKIIEAQRVSRERFTLERVKPYYTEMIKHLTTQTKEQRRREQRLLSIKKEVEERREKYE